MGALLVLLQGVNLRKEEEEEWPFFFSLFTSPGTQSVSPAGCVRDQSGSLCAEEGYGAAVVFNIVARCYDVVDKGGHRERGRRKAMFFRSLSPSDPLPATNIPNAYDTVYHVPT